MVQLLPIYPSPLKDDGYDVADYVDIHPDYGTLDDFQTFVNAVHERSMRVIVDFVPNHTYPLPRPRFSILVGVKTHMHRSADHKWFQMAREDCNSPYRDYYVWTDDPTKYKDARIIFLDTEASNWVRSDVQHLRITLLSTCQSYVCYRHGTKRLGSIIGIDSTLLNLT